MNPRALEIASREDPNQEPPEKQDSKSVETSNSGPAITPSPADRIRPWMWQKGQSGNPSGRPKRDVSAEIARAAFEENADTIYKAQVGRLLKGDPYAFSVLSDRGYGKLKESLNLTGLEGLAEAIAKGRKRIEED